MIHQIISTDDSSGFSLIGTRSNHTLRIGTNDSTALTIDTSQRVGIGTTSPSGSLHVNGANPTVYITNSTQDGASTLLRMTEKKELDGDAGGFLRYVGSNNWFEIGTHISGTDTVHFYLPRDGSGKVGIGHTSPQYGITIAQGAADANKIGTNTKFKLVKSGKKVSFQARNSKFITLVGKQLVVSDDQVGKASKLKLVNP